MEWIKIKVQHVLNTGLTTEEIGRLIQYQALVAHKEREPKEVEIKKVMRVKSLKKLAKSLEELGENLDTIRFKVLNDVEKVRLEREYNRDRKRKYRDDFRLKNGFVPRDVPGNETGTSHAREEERREEEIRYKKNITKKSWDTENEIEENLDSNLYRLDIIKAIDAINQKWPIKRRSNTLKCLERLKELCSVDINTASELVNAASVYLNIQEREGQKPQYYPNLVNWLDTWENYKDLTHDDVLDISSQASEMGKNDKIINSMLNDICDKDMGDNGENKGLLKKGA